MFTPGSRLVRCRAALLSTAATAVLSLTFAAGAHAAPIVITFDAGDPIGGLAAGTTLANQYAAFGVSFSPNAFTGPGGPTGAWATNTDMTVVSSSGGDVGGLGSPSLVSGNILRSFNGWLAENGDPSIRATFGGSGISTFSATFAGVASASSTRLLAYNGATLLGAVSATTLTGQETLTISSAMPITSVVLTPGDFFDWVGVDNITFERIQQVPEPTSMVLLGAGLAGAAIARRRQRRRSPADWPCASRASS